MADEAQTTAAAPPAEASLQDPLPESTWFWRRVFIFGTTTVLIIGVWVMVQTMVNIADGNPELVVGSFVKIIGWLLLYGWFNSTYYLVAPSAEHVTRMWGMVTSLKSGAVFQSRAAAHSPGGNAESSASAGKPPAAQVPDLGEVAAAVKRSLPWDKSA